VAHLLWKRYCFFTVLLWIICLALQRHVRPSQLVLLFYICPVAVLMGVLLRYLRPGSRTTFQIPRSLVDSNSSARLLAEAVQVNWPPFVRLCLSVIWRFEAGFTGGWILAVLLPSQNPLGGLLIGAIFISAAFFWPRLVLRMVLKKTLPGFYIRLSQRVEPEGKRRRPLIWVLGSVRRFRHLKTRFWRGKPPQWATDVYSLLKYVNILELVPTLAAIGLEPYRFFGRRMTGGKPSLRVYKSPVKFLTTATSALALLVTALCAHYLGKQYKPTRIEYVVLVAVLTVPLWSIVLSILVWLTFRAGFVPWWFKRVNWKLTRIDQAAITTILSPGVYRRLDPARFLWGICYFGVYLYAAAILLALITSLAVPLLAEVASVSKGPYTGSLEFFILLNAVFVVAAQRLILHPYSQLLLATAVEAQLTARSST